MNIYYHERHSIYHKYQILWKACIILWSKHLSLQLHFFVGNGSEEIFSERGSIKSSSVVKKGSKQLHIHKNNHNYSNIWVSCIDIQDCSKEMSSKNSKYDSLSISLCGEWIEIIMSVSGLSGKVQRQISHHWMEKRDGTTCRPKLKNYTWKKLYMEKSRSFQLLLSSKHMHINEW